MTQNVDGPLVVAGFAEALASIEAAWSLQRAGFRIAAFCRAGSRPALRRVRGIEIHPVPPPEQDAVGTVDAVHALCTRLAPAALLPLDDQAVWVCSQLTDNKVPLAGAEGYAAECALDKRLQLRTASQAGFSVPPTQVVDDLAQAAATDFPVMVKPACAVYEVAGRLRRPVGVICANAQEFRRAQSIRWPGPVLVQPLIRGVSEGLFGHAGPEVVSAWSAHRRIRMVNPHGSASSACRSQPVDRQLLEPSERFLRTVGWRGMFMLEFLRDSAGEPWFMELNGRAWGSMALARRRGFEYPAWTVRAALESSFEPSAPPAPPEIVCRHLGMEVAHLAFVARGPQSEATLEWPRLTSAVRGVFSFGRSHRLYNWDPSQPGVLLTDTIGTLRHYAGRSMRKS